ncbi:MAG: hypothetical protein AAF988_04240 [Pseudomonadota bacterium]
MLLGDYTDEDLRELRWTVKPQIDLSEGYRLASSIYGKTNSLDAGNFFKLVQNFGAPRILRTKGPWSGFGSWASYISKPCEKGFRSSGGHSIEGEETTEAIRLATIAKESGFLGFYTVTDQSMSLVACDAVHYTHILDDYENKRVELEAFEDDWRTSSSIQGISFESVDFLTLKARLLSKGFKVDDTPTISPKGTCRYRLTQPTLP